MTIQYTSSYLPVPYIIDSTGLIFKKKGQPKQPDTELFNKQIQEHMQQFAEQGYELVSTQHLLRAIDLLPTDQAITTGSTYNITDGILFFWKNNI